MKEEGPEESVMDCEDLTRENWSENDLLLQKIRRLGSRVAQYDFLSSVGNIQVPPRILRGKLNRTFFLNTELVHVINS